jgi:hypothetical protein
MIHSVGSVTRELEAGTCYRPGRCFDFNCNMMVRRAASENEMQKLVCGKLRSQRTDVRPYLWTTARLYAIFNLPPLLSFPS